MEYIVKIVINDSLELFSKPFDSTENVELSDVTYLDNVRLKDSTSLSSAFAFGGTASNTLLFDIVNPSVDNYEGCTIKLFLKGADTGNLPQGNERTDNGEYSLYVTQEELTPPTFDDDDPDAVAINTIGEDLMPEDDIEGDDPVETFVVPEIYGAVDATPEEEAEVDTTDRSANDPYYGNVDAVATEVPEEEGVDITAWSQFGEYYVTASTQNNFSGSVSVEASDAVMLLGSGYYVPTANNVLADVMFEDFATQAESDLGVMIDSNIDMPDLEIEMPSNTTFRDALGYFAGLAGGFATTNEEGIVIIKPYDYCDAEIHSDKFIGKGLVLDSQNAVSVTGITCDTEVGLGENYIFAEDGGGVVFENPFMTEEILEDEIFPRVRNLIYYTGTLECIWNTKIRAGQILKIFTPEDDAERNSLVLAYDEAQTAGEKEAILEQIEQTGRYIVNTNQTISFSEAITSISSLGQNVTQQSNYTNTSTYKKVQKVYSASKVAQEIANEANTMAQATSQHFWSETEPTYFPTTDLVIDSKKTYYEAIYTYALSTDTTVVASKTYYKYENNEYVVVTPAGGEDPTAEGWYERSTSYQPVTPSPGEIPEDEGWYEALGAGAYVTELAQEEFKQTPSGKNSLWNSLGMVFRNGLKNLLAIVTGNTTGVAIYDGQGNSDENIVASFTDSGSVIGKQNDGQLLLKNNYLRILNKEGNNVFSVENIQTTTQGIGFDVFVRREDEKNIGTYTHTIPDYLGDLGVHIYFTKTGSGSVSDIIALENFGNWSINSTSPNFQASGSVSFNANTNTLTVTVTSVSDNEFYLDLACGYDTYVRYPQIKIKPDSTVTGFSTTHKVFVIDDIDDSGNFFWIKDNGELWSINNITAANLTGSQTADYTGSYKMGNCTILTGSVTINVTTANTNTDKAVTFGPTFKHTPCVQCTMLNIGGSYYQRVTAAGPSTTGFTARIRAGGTPGNVVVNWVAIGELA